MAGIIRHNSEMTNDDSTGFADQEETSSLDSIEWTNEKHSMYLKSMEASFIDQLYNSKDFFSWCPPEEHGFDVKLRGQGSPPGLGQSKAHLHGYWQKELYRTALQPLGSGGQILASCGPGNISRMMVDGEHHQVSLSFNEEVSDQNFVSEECENRAARGQRAKRPKTRDASATSSNDQVVPFDISHLSVQEHYKGCSDSRDRMIGRSGRTCNRN